MKLLPVLVLFTLLISNLYQHTYASEKITLATFPIPLMVESESEGIFIELTQEIALRAELDITVQVYPTRRALKTFHDNKVDGIFPALEVTLLKNFIRSSSIYVKEDFGFVTTGHNPPESTLELVNKNVGLTMGYPYTKELTSVQAFFALGANDVTNMKKLARGRIDIFVVEEFSGLKALELSEEEGIHYNPDTPLSRQDVFFAFQDTESGESLAVKFSSALKAMKEDGTFEKLMAKAR